MSDNHTVAGSSFPGLLTIAFVVLKLCGVINWSWWWVLSPIWILLICGLILLLILGVGAAITVFREG